ncbi:uracil-DNA glycosylase [Uliginosibacterium sediminicola]|uniref:Type-4 uracil-DNA glycosylase n=2 Tax=Uliginosibacterium sediminicola TaxID=2024550 RepID=A0ABU9Z0T1_9RHOO
MGIKPLWRLRQAAPQPSLPEVAVALGSTPESTPESAPEPAPEPAPAPRVAEQAMAQLADYPADELINDLAREASRELLIEQIIDVPDDALNALPSERRRIPTDWDGLAAEVAGCSACGLCKARKQAVFGVGDRQADWMFVGEGPGAEEDERGEPFVGQAGKLLDAMLQAIGLKRDKDVYIANAVKCRPPGNRTPEAEEIAACRPYLVQQIELVKPRVLIALGRPAAQTLLGSETSIAAARGKLHHYAGIPLVVTYHPAYLLRNLPDKAKAWEDLCFAMDVMAKQRSAG